MCTRCREELCSEMRGYTQVTEEASASISLSVLVGQRSVLPPQQGTAAVMQHTILDQGCICLGPAPISPGPLVHHKLVLRRLKGESQHQGNTSWGECNMEDQTQGRWRRLQRKVFVLRTAERNGVSSWETRGFPENEKKWRIWAVLSAHLDGAQLLWIQRLFCFGLY